MIAILILFALLFSTDALAVTHTVKQSGGNDGNCANATNGIGLATITKAFQCIGTGAGAGADIIVEVENGTYPEVFRDGGILPPRGTSGHPFTVKAKSGHNSVIIKPTGGDHIIFLGDYGQGAGSPALAVYQTWGPGLKFDCTNINGNCIVLQDNGSASFLSDVTFTGNEIYSWPTGWGLQPNNAFVNGSFRLTFSNNIIRDPIIFTKCDGLVDVGGGVMEYQYLCGYAIYHKGASATYSGNTIHDIPGYGIHSYHYGSNDVVNNTFSGNTIYNFTQRSRGTAIFASSGGNYQIYNNLIYNGGKPPTEASPNDIASCIAIGFQADTVNVYNNTCYNAMVGFNIVTVSSSNVTVRNNILLNMSPGYQYIFEDDGVGGAGGNAAVVSNNLCGGSESGPSGSSHCQFTATAANTFVSPGVDFRLKPTSNAINSGFSPCSTTDIAGNSRQGACDIGAYEFVGAGNILPVIALSFPTSSFVNSTPLTLSGTASDPDGTISSVTWTCTRCGTGGDASSGAASFSAGKWQIVNANLQAGIQTFIVTATDNAGGSNSLQVDLTYTPTFPGNTMALALGFETGSGPIASDSSGNSNNGNLLNGVSWTTNGKYGNALTLNGTNQYISIPSANSLDFTQSFTFSIWAKPAAVHNDFRTLFSKNSFVQRLYASVDASYCANSGPSGFIYVNGVTFSQVCNPISLAIGVWSHVVLTYDHNAGQMKMYVNGTPVQTVSISGLMQPTTNPLTIGATTLYGEYFHGDVDEARAYNWAIPLGSATPGATCQYANYTTTVRGNQNLATVRDDMNCAVIPQNITPPLPVKFPASATGFKVGASATGLKFGSK